MDPVLFTSFILATLIIVASPGPACALASSQAVKYGPRAAVLSIMGDALGTITHILIAVFSLKALINSAAFVLPFLQIAGGMFILYLAYQAYFSDSEHDAPKVHASRSAFLGGFFSCVTNPKAIVFFVALFPGFISPDYSVGMQSLFYGVIFIVLDALSIFAYAMLAMYVVNSTFAPRINIDKVSGLGLFGVGLLLVFKGYKELPTG
jgi:threonine/homoserine/homoserine lactone efflux protein